MIANLKKISYLFLGLIMITGVQTLRAQEAATAASPEECKMKLSLYREYYKHWESSGYKGDYLKDIIESWRWCFMNCPTLSENLYVNGVTIFEYMNANESDAAKKSKYADTIEMIFNNRIKYYPNNAKTKQSQVGNILWRKALSLIKVAPDRTEQIYNDLKKAVELEQNNIPASVLPYYFKYTVEMVNIEKLEKSVIIEVYDASMSIADSNLKEANAANNTKDADDWTAAMKMLEQGFEPFASCEDLVQIFQNKFDANPNDVELLRKITTTLSKKCTENDLFLNATANLFELDPTPQAAYMMAKLYMRNAEYEKAAKSLQEVINLTDDNELKFDTELALAQVLSAQKKYPQAREHARRAHQLKPNNGEPLILIGLMYAGSSDLCADNEISKKSVFWAAVDKFIEAKRIDSSIAEKANEMIARYQQYFPAMERIFFNNFKEGESYKVECWIGETTIIKALKEKVE